MNTTLLKSIFLLLILSLAAPMAHAQGAKKNFVLVIDAGHGGHDSGACGAFSKEKDINLNVALAFGRLVEDNCHDVRVVYTRKRDVFIPLQRRADIANEAKADLFVSVHTNALPGGKQAYGSETYSLGMARAGENLAVAKRENAVITYENDYKKTYQGFDPNKAESYVIFEIMQDKYMSQSVDLAGCIQKEYAKAGRPNKGVHQAGFLVLRNTTMPSVLTELGFITTPKEERYLNSQQGIGELSRSIYNGFLAYRRIHEKGARDIPANLPLQVQADEHPNLSVLPPDRSGGGSKGNNEVAVVPVKTVSTAELMQERQGRDEAANTVTAPARARQELRIAAQDGDLLAENEAAANARNKADKTSAPAKAKTDTPNQKAAKPKAKTEKPRADRVIYRIQVGAGKRAIPAGDQIGRAHV